MAAYAALRSLSHILHQILHPPPLNNIIIDRELIGSLQDKVSFLIDFFETFSSQRCKEIEDLEKRITDAAYEAEDIIESHVVSQIQSQYALHPEKKSRRQKIQERVEKCFPIQKVLKKKDAYQGIPKVIKKFISIQKRLVMIKNNGGMEDVRREKSAGASSSRSLPRSKNIMVGFDEHLDHLKSALATDESKLQIVPIVGMGGIGKTTLATNVYNDSFIAEHFDLRAWVTVTQEYTELEIVRELLPQINSNIDRKEHEQSADVLGNQLYQELFGRRYLIILDDMWDIKVWDGIKRFLPPDGNGSRVLVTTRLLKLAEDVGSCRPYQIGLLDKDKSWDLILEKVFAKEKCPIELEEIGRSIAENCGGLPLALVVIGGLLAKSQMTREFWKHVEEDVTSAANDEDNSHCIKILSSSYSHLPVHLKPCFLYLAMFPKNFEMSVSRLIRLLVAEGFIKPANEKSLEEAAEEYLEDLSDRNLVMVGKRGHSGKVKTYNIHDLLRDLCCREAQKDNFLRIVKLDNPNASPHMERERRLSIHIGTENEKICEVLRSATLSRSFLSYSYWESRRCVARRLNLLRILDVADYYSMDEILQLINSRYITCAISLDMRLDWSFLPLFWNLQTLVVSGSVSLPSEIWQMPQLRHLKMPRITLPDPADAQVDSQNITVLENLQTLTTLKDFIFREQVLKRIPNLKKLGVHCHMAEEIRSFHLSNLVFLHKLESLFLSLEGTWENIAFPVSLKKLALSSCRIPWEDMSIVGSLPRLAVLKLQRNAAEGRTWNPNAGEFSQLKFLMIDSCELEIWEADDTHFPRLEHLHLRHLKLKEMPMDFAQISTLQMIELNYCSYSLFKSAKAMTKEREDLGYEDIQVRSFPSQTPFLAQDNVVGFEDEARTLVKYLIENCEELEVVAIIGMPGLGKTTLAWKIYHDVRIQHEFPTLIWVHVSQYLNDIREVFLTILKELNTPQYRYLTEPELAEIVRSYLEERKFLLFLDDVWNAEAWSLIEAALPRSNRWGKVLITTQDEEVGAWLTNRNIEPHKLRFLNLYESWELLQLKVFGKLDECPSDLKLLGKHIAKQCGGVPLAVVVIAGILFEKLSTSSTDIKDEWEKVLTSLNACLENDEQKLTENIISLSYNKLPHDLRDCFLYLGMFPEQAEIPAWNLIRLWIAEGFVKQKLDNSLEEVAEDNLKNLINRNLVMVGKTKAKDHVRTCRVHHMISKFCKNQAAIANQNFFQEVKKTKEGNFDPPVSDIQKYHRLCIHSDVIDFLRTIPKAPGLHSFLCFSKEEVILSAEYDQSFPDAFNSLRVLDVNPIRFTKFPTEVTKLVDLRYIALSIDDFESLPEAFSKLWNLQTIKIDTTWRTFEIKAHIWKMVNLRHLKTKSAIILNGEGGGGENLQTLSRLSVRCCTEDVFNKASNLKNLGIRGDLNTLMEATCLEKLDRLQKLKLVHEPDVFPYVASEKPLHRLPHADRFPPNLRILTLSSTFLDWRHMTTLGMLLTLEVLKLKENAFIGKLWEAVDGDFPSLESLHIAQTDLEIWTASGDPFPKLKRLVLENCKKLEEIPSVLEKRREILHIERVTRPLVAQARRIELQKQEMQDSQFQAVKMSELASMQLISDLKRLQQDPPAGISGAPCGDYNIMLWNAVIFGPENTPWDGGTFKLTLQFPEDYPDKPPTVRFISRMFHPNIYADGSIDLDILHNQWSPIYDVTAILISIRSLLCDPNPNSLANPEAARLFSENNREYNRNVREIVEQSWTAD